MGSDVAEAQVDDLSDAEIGILLEVYEVLRLTPGNGRKLRPAGNMHVWDFKGISQPRDPRGTDWFPRGSSLVVGVPRSSRVLAGEGHPQP
jgi:hypothetical protein